MSISDKEYELGSFGLKKKPKSPPRNTLAGDEIIILERQNYICAICKKEKLLPKTYHIDHKKPIALGGSNTNGNKQALCPKCHDKKTREDKTKIAKMKQNEKETKKLKEKSEWGF